MYQITCRMSQIMCQNLIHLCPSSLLHFYSLTSLQSTDLFDLDKVTESDNGQADRISLLIRGVLPSTFKIDTDMIEVFSKIDFKGANFLFGLSAHHFYIFEFQKLKFHTKRAK